MLDLFASPGTLIPIVVGASSLMFSWAIGGDPVANAIGIIGVMGGIGHFASRLVFGLESMTKRAYDAMLTRDRDKRDASLDELERKLKQDDDRRTEQCLKELRTLVEMFTQETKRNTLTAKHHRLVSQVEEIFNASVEQLAKSWELHQLGKKLTGQAKEKVLRQREQVIQEVIETRDHLAKTMEQMQSLSSGPNKSELMLLRKELDETLLVAKRTQERMSQIDNSERTYHESDFQQ